MVTLPHALAPATPAAPQDRNEDAELAAACRDGDAKAWRRLVQRHQRLVYAVVSRIGLDEHSAADVFQTVFERLFDHLPRIADPSRLPAWIAVTAKREALLIRKRARRTVSMTLTTDDEEAASWDMADEGPMPGDALEELQQLTQLRRAIDQLDERSRLLLSLLFPANGDQVAYEFVAQRLGIPVGSIGPTRARCLQKLRKLMAE